MTKVIINTCCGTFRISNHARKVYQEITGHPLPRDSDIDRTDPVLADVVESLGLSACPSFSHLDIEYLEPGTKYFIDIHEGFETIHTIDGIDWKTA